MKIAVSSIHVDHLGWVALTYKFIDSSKDGKVILPIGFNQLLNVYVQEIEQWCIDNNIEETDFAVHREFTKLFANFREEKHAMLCRLAFP